MDKTKLLSHRDASVESIALRCRDPLVDPVDHAKEVYLFDLVFIGMPSHR